MRLLRWTVGAAILFAMLLAVWLAVDTVTHPRSTLMLARDVTGQPVDRRWVSLDRVSPTLVSAVIMSEDGQFCRHRGVDWHSLRDVLHHSQGEPSRGASTITMQVAKNLFLWPGRSYVRKAIEIPLAMLLNVIWSKQRVLEVYLNIAELGDGVFGVEAAAQAAFGRPASALTTRQATLLATSLPNPFVRRPNKPNRVHRILADRIARLLPLADGHTFCLR